jgi:hypothetical protein
MEGTCWRRRRGSMPCARFARSACGRCTARICRRGRSPARRPPAPPVAAFGRGGRRRSNARGLRPLVHPRGSSPPPPADRACPSPNPSILSFWCRRRGSMPCARFARSACRRRTARICRRGHSPAPPMRVLPSPPGRPPLTFEHCFPIEGLAWCRRRGSNPHALASGGF